MARNINRLNREPVRPSTRPLPDPVAQEIQQPYIVNGLTYKSNDPYVIERDDAGNIKLYESTSNQRLIIEPSIENVNNRSFVEAVNTQFQYFKFPAKTIADGSDQIDIPNLDIDFDSLSGHYVVQYSDGNDTYKVFNSGSATTSLNNYITIPFDVPRSGPPLAEPGTFIFTPDIIDSLRESNKTIRFQYYMNLNPSIQAINNGAADTQYRARLRRETPIVFQANGGNYDIKDETEIPFPDYGNTFIDFIVNMNEVNEYDRYKCIISSTGESFYLADYSWFDVSVIDDPGPGGYYQQ